MRVSWEPHVHLSQWTKVLYVGMHLNVPLAKTRWTFRTGTAHTVQTTTFPLGRRQKKGKKFKGEVRVGRRESEMFRHPCRKEAS